VSVGSGSGALTAAARVSYYVDKSPDDENLRLLATIKNNLAPEPATLAFRLVSRGEDIQPHVEWLREPVAISAKEMLQKPDRREREIDKAIRFWCEALAKGPQPSDPLLTAGKAKGFSEPTLNRARKEAGVDRKKIQNTWWSFLPGQEDQLPIPRTNNDDLDSVDHLDHLPSSNTIKIITPLDGAKAEPPSRDQIAEAEVDRLATADGWSADAS
jgi:hypothetical protein